MCVSLERKNRSIRRVKEDDSPHSRLALGAIRHANIRSGACIRSPSIAGAQHERSSFEDRFYERRPTPRLNRLRQYVASTTTNASMIR